jgi:hypothetical protein
MQLPPLFVPECYADTALMLTLLRENSANETALADIVNHQHGIGNVDNALKEQWEMFGPARRVVGLVDLDKDFQKHFYLNQFTRLLAGSLQRGAHSHALLQHPVNTTHYLVVLNPAFEKWLAARAAELGTTLAACGLPSEPKAFKSYSRMSGLKRSGQLRQLLNAIATARHPAYAAPASFIAAVMHLDGPLP